MTVNRTELHNAADALSDQLHFIATHGTEKEVADVLWLLEEGTDVAAEVEIARDDITGRRARERADARTDHLLSLASRHVR